MGFRNGVTWQIIGAAIEVHRHLGPGLLERAYEHAMRQELNHRGIRFISQVHVPVMYKGTSLGIGCRVDLVVEDEIIVELKAVERVTKLHTAQLLTYLRWLQKPIGLLINFNVPTLKDGIHRRINT